jgi:hypothetical protein
MDVATFVVELVKALAWPVTLILLAMFFRKQLIGLFEGLRLRRLKGKDFEIEFEEGMKAVRKEIPQKATLTAQRAEPESESARFDLSPDSIDDDLIAHAPQGAIVAAWTKLEGTLTSAAEQFGLTDVPPTSVGRILDGLAKKGVLQPTTLQAITTLRHLRNLVVHSTGSAQERISPEKAREFVAMASAVAWTVEGDVRNCLSKKNG